MVNIPALWAAGRVKAPAPKGRGESGWHTKASTIDFLGFLKYEILQIYKWRII